MVLLNGFKLKVLIFMCSYSEFSVFWRDNSPFAPAQNLCFEIVIAALPKTGRY